MTPSESELHAGAKRIAEEWPLTEQHLAEDIIALAESHAAAETAAMREALERLARLPDENGEGTFCMWCEGGSGEHREEACCPIGDALATGAGARHAERVAKLEAVAKASAAYRKARHTSGPEDSCSAAELVLERAMFDALAALDAGEKEPR